MQAKIPISRFFLLTLICLTIVQMHFGKGIHSNQRDMSNQLIIDINEFTYTIARQHDQFYSFIGVRALTLVHLSIHDILNSVDPKFKPYLYNKKVSSPFNLPQAIIASTQTILEQTYPERIDTINRVCSNWAERYPADTRSLSQSFGEKIANLYLSHRAQDGHQNNGTYNPMTKPGDYQYTPGYDYVWKPDFSLAMPFTLDSINQFRSPAPPSLLDEDYTDSYNEVKKYGCKKSTVRSADQTAIGHWWAEFGEHSWNRIGRIVGRSHNLSATKLNRLFALLNMNLYDLYLVSFDSKYYYDTWRPITAIHQADQDDNPYTVADPHWEPEMVTPPWPEYPSAHAATGAAGAEIITLVLRTSKVHFTMKSTTALDSAQVRSYEDLTKAANDCADSRIFNGYHFRFATEAGKQQGRTLAKHTVDHYLVAIP